MISYHAKIAISQAGRYCADLSGQTRRNPNGVEARNNAFQHGGINRDAEYGAKQGGARPLPATRRTPQQSDQRGAKAKPDDAKNIHALFGIKRRGHGGECCLPADLRISRTINARKCQRHVGDII